jgi:hypothetical protein
VATEAAWLNGINLEKEEIKKKNEKMKEKAWHSPAFSWKGCGQVSDICGDSTVSTNQESRDT